jgi:aspartyl-tRNA(Asn)/glutamyl-tRNA(Gln) amidotransferase subunit C
MKCDIMVFMITKADVEKLASLSRIKLSDAEKESLCTEMESILGYVEEIQSVSAQVSSGMPAEHRNIMRDDSAPHESGAFTDVLLKEAPRSDQGYVVVKKIL